MSAAAGLSRTTVHKGLQELVGNEIPPDRVRKVGGGRKPISHHEPELIKALELLVEPTTRGDPMCALRWTCKSTPKLAAELRRQGYRIEARTVARLLHDGKYSLQANRKTREGSSHPDRNAQFEYIPCAAAGVSAAWAAGYFGGHQEEGTGRGL